MRGTDRLQEAETYWNDALAIRKALAADPRATPGSHHSLAVTLSYLGELRQVQKQFRLSCDLLQQAVAHHEVALKAAPRSPTYRTYYRQTRYVLAGSLVKLGDHAAAATAARQFFEIGVDPANDSYAAACLLARCATLAEKDSKLLPKQREQESESYANRAIELLRTALKKGFANVGRLSKDQNLDALRSRKEFKELLVQLEEQGPKGKR